MPAKAEAVFGGGCFWCTEAVFVRLKGVTAVTPGYAGGHLPDPDYHAVCSGTSGHAEVVKIAYDPSVITYQDLLDVFFYIHDPTTLNRQGNDIGEQYRSIILYSSESERTAAQGYVESLNAGSAPGKAVVTELKPLERFYPAEEYHRDYYDNNAAQPYCRAIIGPKLSKFGSKFSRLLK